jgi:hypothetical protein
MAYDMRALRVVRPKASREFDLQSFNAGEYARLLNRFRLPAPAAR